MKMKSLTLLITVLILFIACEEDGEEATPHQIVGEWTKTSMTLSVDIDGMDSFDWFKVVLLYNDTDATNAEAVMVNGYSATLPGSTLEFKADNTYSSDLNGSSGSGDYAVADDQILFSGNAGSIIMNIDQLSNSNLALSWVIRFLDDVDDDGIFDAVDVSVSMQFDR